MDLDTDVRDSARDSLSTSLITSNGSNGSNGSNVASSSSLISEMAATREVVVTAPYPLIGSSELDISTSSITSSTQFEQLRERKELVADGARASAAAVTTVDKDTRTDGAVSLALPHPVFVDASNVSSDSSEFADKQVCIPLFGFLTFSSDFPFFLPFQFYSRRPSSSHWAPSFSFHFYGNLCGF
jgi:hypothetical protein